MKTTELMRKIGDSVNRPTEFQIYQQKRNQELDRLIKMSDSNPRKKEAIKEAQKELRNAKVPRKL